MKFHPQQTGFSCGPSAMKNCLISLRHRPISERKLRQLAKTNKDGTNSKPIVKAFEYLGYQCSELVTKSKHYFKRVLLRTLKDGGKCIVSIDATTHWIAVIGYERRKITFIDSDFKRIKQTFNVRYFIPMCRNYDKMKKQEYYQLIKIKKCI